VIGDRLMGILDLLSTADGGLPRILQLCPALAKVTLARGTTIP
jgi:hypothetical protein